ncbi:class I SAM-dependent methyltransferase [Gordonia phthalatica]|uniref:class I SAM-dependent methyltransferase n=1 Tax=Gordonia phthalatica TaxID=1136941 RepID=UPI001D058045|nr:class I SAM-dependent methyltransferase [Gordonia phthalatica]
MTDYWNHNVAYHRELVDAAARRGGSVLDVGCGDGLLLARMSEVADRVVGIDADRAAVVQARARLDGRPNARVVVGDVMTSPELDGESFDLVVSVAALHHLPLESALLRLRDLVAPGGELRIIGLSANRSAVDWAVSGALVVPVRVMSRLRGEADYDGMVTTQPRDSLAQIRLVARATLPGSRVRRRFYYRYALTWTKPI